MQPESVLTAAVFPIGSRADDSPLFLLCMNDTCSFTWTGDEHINQVCYSYHFVVWCKNFVTFDRR